jgi:hypothetical protein
LLSNPFAGASGPHKRSTEQERELHAKIKNTWGEIRKNLIYEGIDFDNLDTEIMAAGEIKDGKIIVGRAEYEILILPPLMCIESGAAGMIREFASQGGTVLYVGMKPFVDIDGDYGFDAEQIETENISERVKPHLDQSVTVSYNEKFAKTLLVTRRYDAEGSLYLYVSNQENNALNITLTINGPDPCHFEQLSFETGESLPIAVFNNKLTLQFKPFELKALKLVKGKHAQSPVLPPEFAIDVDAEMPVRIDGENILPFDSFDFSVDGIDWAAVDVSTVDNQLDASGFAARADQIEVKGQGFGLPKQIRLTYPKTVQYKKTFRCGFVPANINLLMDESTIQQSYEIRLNGNLIDNSAFAKCFVNDIKNIKAPINGFIKQGENELHITVTCENNWGGIRDNIYITGDFALYKGDGGWIISKPTGKAKLSHTYIDGYPYYSGTFTFSPATSYQFGDYLFSLSNKKIHDCVELIVNDISLGVRAFAPYEWSGELDHGNNTIEVKLTNTLINMLEGGYFDYDEHNFVKI